MGLGELPMNLKVLITISLSLALPTLAAQRTHRRRRSSAKSHLGNVG